MYLSQVLFIFSAALIGALATSDSCAPVQANVHESLRCEERKDTSSSAYHYNHDCCAGSDYSSYPGNCANGFIKRETGSCGYGNSWCDAHGCKEFTCVKSSSCVQYFGCLTFTSTFWLNKASISWTSYATEYRVQGIVSECANYCRRNGYTYAVVHGAGTCYCSGASLPDYGGASGSLCGLNARGTLALSCGDGSSATCNGDVHAVYSLTGTESCCEYKTPYDSSTLYAAAAATSLIIYLVCGIGCGLMWTVGPCIIGYCIFLQMRKNRVNTVQVVRSVNHVQHAGVTVVTPTVVTAQPQPSVAVVKAQPEPVLPMAQPAAAAYPATQNVGVVVAQPASNPTL